MIKFYEKLDIHNDISVALQITVKELLQQNAPTSSWAGYLLVGQWLK